MDAIEDDGWSWAIIEIMGFRKHAGRIREVEQFGTKMLRIDIPVKGDPAKNGWETHCYGGPSIFSITPTDEATALKINKPYEAPATYRLPAPVDDFDQYDEPIVPKTEKDRIKEIVERAEARAKDAAA